MLLLFLNFLLLPMLKFCSCCCYDDYGLLPLTVVVVVADAFVVAMVVVLESSSRTEISPQPIKMARVFHFDALIFFLWWMLSAQNAALGVGHEPFILHFISPFPLIHLRLRKTFDPSEK